MKTILLAILFVVLLAGGAQADQAIISWVDLSNNETGFKVERNLNGGVFTVITTTAANINSLIDTTLVQALIDNKYCYRLSAVNSAGQSGFAPTATPGITDCKTIAALVVIPIDPGGLLVQ